MSRLWHTNERTVESSAVFSLSWIRNICVLQLPTFCLIKPIEPSHNFFGKCVESGLLWYWTIGPDFQAMKSKLYAKPGIEVLALPGHDNSLPPTFRCWDVNGPWYILWSRMKNPISSLLVQCWHFANLINHPKLPILNKFWERGSLWEKEEGKNTKLERMIN